MMMIYMILKKMNTILKEIKGSDDDAHDDIMIIEIIITMIFFFQLIPFWIAVAEHPSLPHYRMHASACMTSFASSINFRFCLLSASCPSPSLAPGCT